MFRSRFFWKLYLGVVLIIFVATASVELLVSYRIEQDALADIESSLLARTAMLREIAAPILSSEAAATNAKADALQTHVQELGHEIATRLTVIREDGLVLADSEESPSIMDDHGSRPEVLDARQRGVGQALRHSDTLKTSMMYVALAVQDERKLTGFVRGSLPLAEVDARLGHVRRTVVLGALLSASVALLMGVMLVRRVTGPLRAMTKAVGALAEGEKMPLLPAGGKDEVGELAAAFASMSSRLQTRFAKLSAERNKLQAILGAMVEGVIAVDRQGLILHMNAMAGSLLGVNPLESSGRPYWEVARAPDINTALRQCLEEQTELNQEVLQLAPEGDRVIELYGSPLTGGDGSGGAVLVLHEVTELRRLESVRRDFVANVSHELKTPLTAIRGLVETMEGDRSMQPETRRRFLGKIRSQAEHMSTQIRDLLALSRLETDECSLDMGRVDLVALVRETLELLAAAVDVKGLDLQLEVAEEPLEVRGERMALEQALYNLLDNAIKYTQQGGEIRLRLRCEDGKVVVEVADTGIGIEPSDLRRIFERFYRVDRARSREQSSTGLGLAIVKHVALRHGGEVTVESSPGRGSCFRLVLPLFTGSS